MSLNEYRIILPMTVAEYQIALMYNIAHSSKDHTTEDEGIQVVKNESFQNKPLFGKQFASGQYTYKIYHLASKIPHFIRQILPKKAKTVHEEAWNAYPYCRTILTHPSMGSFFKITIESIHLDDAGQTENAHCLSKEMLEKRKVIYIDIANDNVSCSEFATDADPSQYKSEKTNRGPLGIDWQFTTQPIMTCYKLVNVYFGVFGIQNRVEWWIQNAERRLFLKFHRHLFCTIDQWYGLTMDDIRKMEKEIEDHMHNVLLKRSESVNAIVDS